MAVAGRSSTFEPSFRVLYQPIGPSERIAYQSHVEGTARQISIGAVGLALLLFSRGGAFNALNLFYLLVPILGLWIVAAILVHREYRVRLFEGLKERASTAEIRRAARRPDGVLALRQGGSPAQGSPGDRTDRAGRAARRR